MCATLAQPAMKPDTVSAPGHAAADEADGLARSAGVTGAATLASRLLGLARDQVLAGFFGAGNEMDAFIVAFRIPNLVRDLFAEGAMSAAFVPTFTRQLTLKGKADAWRLGNNVLNALLHRHRRAGRARHRLRASRWSTLYAGDFARVPGKLELTVRLTRVMLPFLTMVAVAAAVMGMLNSLHHYFVPALSPAMFNIATIACAFALVPMMPPLGLPPIMAIALAALVGGFGQVAIQWPALRREGFRYQRHLRSARPRPAAGADADGAGHDRPRRDTGEPLREHAAGDEPGHGRRIVADVRVPPHVPADRAVRRVDRHGGAAGGVAPCGGRTTPPGSARPFRAGSAMMLMLNVPATLGLFVAGDADRAAAVRARALPAGRHRGDGRGGRGFYAMRPRRLFRGAHCVADLLRDRRQPRAGARQRGAIGLNVSRASRWSA